MNLEETRRHALECLANHEYKKLASWGEGSCVWECSRPGSSTYAFTICITRMGIAVVGDITSTTFNVGSNYGMPFLAGEDLSYYIHSKLDPGCRKNELDREKLIFTVTQEIMEHLFSDMSDDDVEVIEQALGNKLPEMVFNSHEAAEFPKDCKDLLQMLFDKEFDIESDLGKKAVTMPIWKQLDDCLDLISEADTVDSLDEAYRLLDDFNLFHFDMCDIDIDKPAEELMFRLCMINEAAKKIVEIEKTTVEEASDGK